MFIKLLLNSYINSADYIGFDELISGESYNFSNYFWNWFFELQLSLSFLKHYKMQWFKVLLSALFHTQKFLACNLLDFAFALLPLELKQCWKQSCLIIIENSSRMVNCLVLKSNRRKVKKGIKTIAEILLSLNVSCYASP